jgi:signal transduction histidine kinase/ActR/RegA family two-component response regulator
MRLGPLRPRSVRQKLLIGALITSISALLVATASLFLYDLHTYRQTASMDLAIQAELLGHSSEAALQFDDRLVASQNLSFLQARPTIRRAAIYDAQGAVFASYARPDLGGLGLPAREAESLSIAGDRLQLFRPIRPGKASLGTVYLDADLEMGKRAASFAAIAFAVVLCALAIAAFISSRLQAVITRPIIQISEVARDVVARRDYAVRAARTTDDEIGTLVDAFNEMLSEIQKRTAAMEASSAEVVSLNRDLERRVDERTLELQESNRQLSNASLAKSSFLSTMSHEIRTPMNGVLGMLELLSLTSLDPHQRSTLEIVRESGRSLLRIIDDILDFSKIEAGKLEVRPEHSSISKLVANVVGIYSGNASSKALTLSAHIDPRISPSVMVDPLRLQQILNNLVSNAIKFTSQGAVEIRAELLDRRDGEDVIQFSVRDTGIGIPPDVQHRLFRPYEQGNAGIAQGFGGTGLGLSIAQRLAGLMGGSIGIESQVGKGTTMKLVLPMPIAPAESAEAAREALHREASSAADGRRTAPSVEQAQGEGTLALVVDDHPINRLVLLRQMNVLGYAAESANDGRIALEKWKSGRFRLLVTDCNMPEMDGYELARQVRERERTTGGPRAVIIACTANALRGEVDNCLAAGMDDYLAKPVEITALGACLDKWMPLSRD